MPSSLRKPIAILALFVILGVWIWLAAIIGSMLIDEPRWMQLVFYVVAGIGWVIPLRPIFIWMNSARD